MINKKILVSNSINESRKKGVYINSCSPIYLNKNESLLLDIEYCWVEQSYKNDVGFIFNGIKKLDTFNLIVKIKEFNSQKIKPYKVTSVKNSIIKSVLHPRSNDYTLVETLKKVEDMIAVEFEFEKTEKLESIEVELIKKVYNNIYSK